MHFLILKNIIQSVLFFLLFIHRQENTDPPVSAVSQEPKLVPSKLNSESDSRQPSVEVSTRVGKDMTAFLQKLRDARQPKPAW